MTKLKVSKEYLRALLLSNLMAQIESVSDAGEYLVFEISGPDVPESEFVKLQVTKSIETKLVSV